jgi:hypothetical protein
MQYRQAASKDTCFIDMYSVSGVAAERSSSTSQLDTPPCHMPAGTSTASQAAAASADVPSSSADAAAAAAAAADAASVQWADKHKPASPDELLVHKRKVGEVQAWLQVYLEAGKAGYCPTRVLLVTGGCVCWHHHIHRDMLLVLAC